MGLGAIWALLEPFLGLAMGANACILSLFIGGLRTIYDPMKSDRRQTEFFSWVPEGLELQKSFLGSQKPIGV